MLSMSYGVRALDLSFVWSKTVLHMIRSQITPCVCIIVPAEGVSQLESRTVPTTQPPVANSTHTPSTAEEVDDYDSDDASKTPIYLAHD